MPTTTKRKPAPRTQTPRQALKTEAVFAEEKHTPVQPLDIAEPVEDPGSPCVTVLFGYGTGPSHLVSYIDQYTGKGGVFRNVPLSVATHWKNGTRPDGTPGQRLKNMVILPENAQKSDFVRAVGFDPENVPPLPKEWHGTRSEMEDFMSEWGEHNSERIFDSLLRFYRARA